jgi:hypothetical protein
VADVLPRAGSKTLTLTALSFETAASSIPPPQQPLEPILRA